jgi:HSP20 family protein
MSARLNRLAGLSPREQEYVVKADVPAMKKEEVKVRIEDGVFAIEGERKQEEEEKTKKYHHTERSDGKFVRRNSVPADVDEQKVAADYKNAALTVRLPKDPGTKPAAIDVKIA